jgi:hypothetical protein
MVNEMTRLPSQDLIDVLIVYMENKSTFPSIRIEHAVIEYTSMLNTFAQ